MIVGVPREVKEGERRVACTPQTVKTLLRQGFEVVVEPGAGEAAAFPDQLYVDAGARLAEGPEAVWSGSDIVLKLNPPAEHPSLGRHEVDLMREGATLLSFIWPAQNPELLDRLNARRITALAMDQVPRITRAQKMDALSSMANIAGYRAVVEAATHFGSFFTGQFTAAGKVPPAKVLVIGAGVAGLAAIGAARGLGAIVRAFDTRESVRDQVKSMGGEFLEVALEESGEGGGGYAKEMSKEFIEAEMALFKAQAPEIDIVITTALIPGRPAPKLWLKEAVDEMKPGSVIVDLAARNGGNCELTRPNEVVTTDNGVTIIGYADLTTRLATTASNLYGNNLTHFLDDLGKAEGFHVNLEDEVIRGSLVTHGGETLWPPPKPEVVKPAEPAPATAAAAAPSKEESKAAATTQKQSGLVMGLVAAALAILWVYLKTTSTASSSPETVAFVQHLTVFVLAVFVGWQVVWNVTAALHTPLMSVTNAISGIIVVGGLLQAYGKLTSAAVLLGGAAILFATINIAGGFLVTQRMLKMFRK